LDVMNRLQKALKVDPTDKLSRFANFLRLTWGHLGLPEPTPIQLDMADSLQFGDRRQVIEAFRGAGKSWITSAFVVWLLLRDPQLNILVVSASKVRADDFSTFTQRLILEMPILTHLIPKKDQRFSKVSFDVGPAGASHAPSVKSMGITGQLAGSRADVIIGDDVEVPNNSMTQALREKLSESVKEFDAILKPNGRILFLGTPQLDMSLYNVLGQRGYTVRIWPARFPAPEMLNRYGTRLAPIITKLNGVIGMPTDPKRFSVEDLLERELSYGRSGFALQFMLDTSLSDADKFPLKVRDLVVMDIDIKMAPENVIWASDKSNRLDNLPNAAMDGDYFHRPMATPGDYIDYQGKVLVIDPSGRGSDETSYAVVNFLNGNLFVPDAGGVSGGYDEQSLKDLCMIAKTHKVNLILVESNFGDGMFTALLKPYLKKIYPCEVEEVRHNQQKEHRIIDTLEPVMNQHRLVISPSVIQKDFDSVQDLPPEKQMDYMLIYQMTRMTKVRGAVRHDDRLDALAMGVAYWVEKMGLDQREELQKRIEEREQRIYDGIFGLIDNGPEVFVRHHDFDYDNGNRDSMW